jgi:hypothetical protein
LKNKLLFSTQIEITKNYLKNISLLNFKVENLFFNVLQINIKKKLNPKTPFFEIKFLTKM